MGKTQGMEMMPWRSRKSTYNPDVEQDGEITFVFYGRRDCYEIKKE